jgi:hypothetical protein
MRGVVIQAVEDLEAIGITRNAGAGEDVVAGVDVVTFDVSSSTIRSHHAIGSWVKQ